MSGLNRKYFLHEGNALNRRHFSELSLEVAGRLSHLMGYNIGDSTLLRTDFQSYTWEDFYFSTENELNYATPPGNMVAPGAFLSVDFPDHASQLRVQWNAWVAAAGGVGDPSQMIMVCPTVGGEPVYDAADVRQGGSVTVYDPAPATVSPFDGKLTSNFFALGDRFTMGGESYLDIPAAGKLSIGLLVVSIGKFRVRNVSLLASRLAR